MFCHKREVSINPRYVHVFHDPLPTHLLYVFSLFTYVCMYDNDFYSEGFRSSWWWRVVLYFVVYKRKCENANISICLTSLKCLNSRFRDEIKTWVPNGVFDVVNGRIYSVTRQRTSHTTTGYTIHSKRTQYINNQDTLLYIIRLELGQFCFDNYYCYILVYCFDGVFKSG